MELDKNDWRSLVEIVGKLQAQLVAVSSALEEFIVQTEPIHSEQWDLVHRDRAAIRTDLRYLEGLG